MAGKQLQFTKAQMEEIAIEKNKQAFNKSR